MKTRTNNQQRNRINHPKGIITRLFCTVSVLLLLFVAQSAQAVTINLRVLTDKSAYAPGETVYWALYAWSSTNYNYGIAMLSLNLDDSLGEALELPYMNGTEFMNTEFNASNGYIKVGTPLLRSDSPRLEQMAVMQMPPHTLTFGNDGTERLFAVGQYTVTEQGTHQLTPSVYQNAANYWRYENSISSNQFETVNPIAATFDVYYRADINKDGRVDILDLNIMAAQWIDAPSVPSADIEPIGGDGIVNMDDFAVLASEWLLGT